jgi:hypothetical protein
MSHRRTDVWGVGDSYAWLWIGILLQMEQRSPLPSEGYPRPTLPVDRQRLNMSFDMVEVLLGMELSRWRFVLMAMLGPFIFHVDRLPYSRPTAALSNALSVI